MRNFLNQEVTPVISRSFVLLSAVLVLNLSACSTRDSANSWNKRSSKEKYTGQDEKHVRVLLAEIVADAVSQRLLADRIEANRADYEYAA